MEVSAIFLSLLWDSFPTPAASQKANYACQWPASSNRISDGCGAISVSASLCPEQSSQETLAGWQQVISAACFATLSAQTAYFKPFCDISPTCPKFPSCLPLVYLRGLQVTIVATLRASGKSRNLTVRLTNWAVGKIPLRPIWWRLPLNYLWRNGFQGLEEIHHRNMCVETDWDRDSKVSRQNYLLTPKYPLEYT